MKPLPEREREALITVTANMYFETEERRTARQMLKEGKSYEEAIAYLVQCGQESLRKTLPLFLTIPGGRVHIARPDCPSGSLAYIALPLVELARHAFPPLKSPVTPSSQMVQYEFFEVAITSSEPVKKQVGRPKKHTFVERTVRVGTRKLFSEQPAWVMEQGWLGYAIRKFASVSHEVQLIHLKSNHALTSLILLQIDETSHIRIRDWVSEVHESADWSRGIQAILKEVSGTPKQQVLARQLEERWHVHRDKPLQVSFF